MFIKIKVKTKVKKDFILQKSKDSFVIEVRDEAQENKANKKVLKLLSSFLGIDENRLRIIKGHHNSSKILEILD